MLNCQSITAIRKRAALCQYIYKNNLDIIFLSETWLYEECSNNELFFNDYNVIRKDRNHLKHGGILFAFKRDFQVTQLDIPINNDNIIAIKVNFNSRDSFIMVGVYNAPSTSKYRIKNSDLAIVFKHMKKLAINLNIQIYIMGDFNFPFIDWQTGNGSSMDDDFFIELMDSLFLNQWITFPTHNNGNTLDLFFTDVDNDVSITRSNCLDNFSDHYGIVIVIKCDSSFGNYQLNEDHINVANWDIKNINNDQFVAINKAIYNERDHFISDNDTIDNNIERFYAVVSNIFANLAPNTRKITRKRRMFPSWYSSHTVHLIDIKNTIHRKLQRANHNSQTFINLSKRHAELEKQVNSAINDDNTDFFGKFAHAYDNRFIFKHFNDLRKNNTLNILDDNGNLIKDNNRLASYFNAYFNSMYHRSTNDIDNSSINNSSTCQNNEDHNNYLITVTISPDDVISAINHIYTNGAAGGDKFSIVLYKKFKHSLKYCLANLFNHICKNRCYPSNWKHSTLIPIPKCKQSNRVSDYRPVALLPAISKIFEFILYKKLYPIIDSQLNNNQYGFRPARSTISQMINFLDIIYTKLDNSRKVMTLYTDFSKAFDSINHDVMIDKLRFNFKLDNFWITMFTSYLSGRTHSVKISNCRSSILSMLSGVPQGSVLGPVLFTLYINDLPNVSRLGNCFLYADDAKFILNSELSHTELQSELDRVVEWCNNNQLVLNDNKCAIVNFSYCKSKEDDSTTLTVNAKPILIANSQKDLGIITTSNLNWSINIKDRIVKANRIFGFIKRNCHKNSNINLRKFIWTTYIRPVLSYGSQCYYPSLSDLASLENFQKRVLRWVSNNYDDPYIDVLKALDCIPFAYFRIWLDLLYHFQHINTNNLCSAPLVQPKSNSHSTIGTRQQNHLEIKHVMKEHSKHNYYWRIVHTLNIINSNIHLNWENKSQFTKQLWNYLTILRDTNYCYNNKCTWHVKCNCPACRGTFKSRH